MTNKPIKKHGLVISYIWLVILWLGDKLTNEWILMFFIVALAECVPLYPQPGEILCDGGWLGDVIKMLKQVKGQCD